MQTANLNGKRASISYKCNTGLYTRLTSPTGRTAQFGGDVYTFDDTDDFLVLVGTSHNGSTLQSTTTIVTANEYAAISDLDDPYNEMKYHLAVMNKLGFE